jgi:UDP-N-acetylglucosamine acyltransferase
MATTIHPSAVVDPSADLDDGVVVGPHAVIGGEVVVGADCEIGAGARLLGPTVVGRENRIYPNACVGFDPQDLKFHGERVTLEVGNGNIFREFCTVHRGTGEGGGRTTIGDDNLIMVYTHIAHDCHVGSRTIFTNNASLAGHVVVEDDATIGAFATVHQFARIGRHAWIGPFTQLRMDALPYAKTVGVRALCYGPNRIGLMRKGMSKETVRSLDRAFGLLVRAGLNTRQAVAAIEEELGAIPEVRNLIEFIASSSRGVHKRSPKQASASGADSD